MNTQGMIPLKENDSKKISDRYQKKTYAKGATCIYGDTLYRAKADITTAEEWTAAHWEETNMETIRAEMAAEVSSLNAKTFHKINAYKDITVTSTNKVYSGLSVTIPANSVFSITADALYFYTPAQWVGISSTQTSVLDCYENANTGYNHASVTYSGYTDSYDLTVYIWAQWSEANSTSNRVKVSGFYF